MTLALHSLAPAKGARQKKFRIGRGNASGRGTTAGRGTKGQRARTGGRNRLKLKGLKQMLLSFPKQRGFKSNYPTIYAIRLSEIMQRFNAGETVEVRTLKSKGLIRATAKYAKVIGDRAKSEGITNKALTFKGVAATASAKEAVIKAGGSFISAK